MLVRQLVVGALALLICSQRSTESLASLHAPKTGGSGGGTLEHRNIPLGDITTARTKNNTRRSLPQPAAVDAETLAGFAPELGADRSEEVANVTPVPIISATKWSFHAGDGNPVEEPLDTLRYDVSGGQLPADGGAFLAPGSSDVYRGRSSHLSGVSWSLPDGVGDVASDLESLDAGLAEVRFVDQRFLPLILMGDPEPVEKINDCTYNDPQSDYVETFVDAFDDGCASCEMDDEGQPIKEHPVDIAEYLPPDVDPQTGAEQLRQLFQEGLLDKDTFSAEDRRRGALRLSSQPSTNCTCSVSDQETICSSGGIGRFCDQLPYTTVPSGILEVSHTNIAELDAGSLEFVANVSVLRLAWNEVALVEPGVFANMSLLTNLSLAHNRLDALDPRALTGAAELREIVLASNRFTELTLATRALTDQFTPKLAHLNIGGNNFSEIGPEDFASMTGLPLEDLQLHENNIEHIDSTTFLGLKHLRRLRIRHNNLPIDEVVALVNEMNNTALELIDLSRIGEYSISQLNPVLRAIADTSILTLMINNYCFPSISGRNFPDFLNLKELSMRSCGIRYIYPNSFNSFKALRSLDLRDNYLTYIPTAVVLPDLESLDLSRPALRKFSGAQKPAFTISQYRLRDMHNLKYLDLSYNNLTTLERGAFVGLENLTVLLLKDTELNQIANFSFSMLENLSELHLSGNYLTAQPFEHLWQGLTELTVLFLDHCRINTSQLYLSEMPRTEILNLTGNALRNLTATTFHGLSSLNTIDISDNSVVSWSERVFADARTLERIYLRYNGITWISSAMAEDFMELNLRVLMLGYNPFHCSCHLHDWLDGQDDGQDIGGVMTSWMLTKNKNGGYITNDIDDCYCSSPAMFSNETVLEFLTHADLSPCAEPSTPTTRTQLLLTMLPVFVSGMVAALLIRLVYKNRWYLRYLLFKLTSKRWLKRLRKDNEGFLYDAFVSYSSEDAGFVSEMIEQLERTTPFYRLCVYERDFEIGNVISECILESINTSRKSILILTDHFAKSHWCRWEMNLVQCRLFEQTRDDLILVKLGKIRSRHLTPTIRYLMRTRIYIEWGPSAQQQLLFWERLRTALRRPGGTPELPRTV